MSSTKLTCMGWHHLDFSPVQSPITTHKDISSVSSSRELISDQHVFSKKDYTTIVVLINFRKLIRYYYWSKSWVTKFVGNHFVWIVECNWLKCIDVKLFSSCSFKQFEFEQIIVYYNRLEFTSSSCVFNEKEKKHLRSGRWMWSEWCCKDEARSKHNYK